MLIMLDFVLFQFHVRHCLCDFLDYSNLRESKEEKIKIKCFHFGSVSLHALGKWRSRNDC